MEVGFRMILLEGSGSISMPIYISIGLVLFGLFALWQGVRIRREPIPRFVVYCAGNAIWRGLSYHSWVRSSSALSAIGARLAYMVCLGFLGSDFFSWNLYLVSLVFDP